MHDDNYALRKKCGPKKDPSRGRWELQQSDIDGTKNIFKPVVVKLYFPHLFSYSSNCTICFQTNNRREETNFRSQNIIRPTIFHQIYAVLNCSLPFRRKQFVTKQALRTY